MADVYQIGEDIKAIKDIVNNVSPRGLKSIKTAGFRDNRNLMCDHAGRDWPGITNKTWIGIE